MNIINFEHWLLKSCYTKFNTFKFSLYGTNKTW